MGKSVAEAQAEIDSAEFCYWQAYDRLNPIGERRADMRAALVAHVVANAHRTRGRPFTVEDFLLRFNTSEVTQTPDTLRANLERWAKGINAQYEK